MRLQNKTAVITGGSSGIGLATAKAIALQGGNVVLFSRNPDRLEEAKKQLAIYADKESILSVEGDVCCNDDLERLFQDASNKFGDINMLVISAVVERHQSLLEIDRTLFRQIFSTNVEGPFFTLQKAIPFLSKNASVVFISSVLADSVRPDGPFIYAASKAALNRMVLYLANEDILLSNKINLTIVSPGPTATPLLKDIPDDVLKKVKASLPRQEFSTPEEVSHVILNVMFNAGIFHGCIIDCSGGARNLPLATRCCPEDIRETSRE